MKHFFDEQLEKLKQEWTPVPRNASTQWLEIQSTVLKLVEDLASSRSTIQQLFKDVERATNGFNIRPFLTEGQVMDLMNMLKPFEGQALKQYGNTLWAMTKYVTEELTRRQALPQWQEAELGWDDVSALVESKRIKSAFNLARTLVSRQVGLDTPERKAAMDKLGQVMPAKGGW